MVLIIANKEKNDKLKNFGTQNLVYIHIVSVILVKIEK